MATSAPASLFMPPPPLARARVRTEPRRDPEGCKTPACPEAARDEPLAERPLPIGRPAGVRTPAARPRPGRATIASSGGLRERELAIPGGRDGSRAAGRPHPARALRERGRGRVQGRDRPRHRGGPRLRARDPGDDPRALPRPRHRHRGDRPRPQRLALRAGSSTRSTARSTSRTPIRSSAPRWRSRVDGEIVAGAVFDPLRDELFTAERGAGAHLNGRAAAGLGRAPADREPADHRLPLRPAPAARGAAALLQPRDGHGARRAPRRLGGARPVLRGGGPRRRLLGGDPEALGHARGPADRRGGRRPARRASTARPLGLGPDGVVATNGLIQEALVEALREEKPALVEVEPSALV